MSLYLGVEEWKFGNTQMSLYLSEEEWKFRSWEVWKYANDLYLS